MKFNIFVALTIVLSVVSCKKDNASSANQEAPVAVDTVQTQAVDSATAVQQVPVSVPTTAPQSGNQGLALNPEHGQPGHRCDIPVGASLNSAPTAVTTQPASVLPPSIQSQEIQPSPVQQAPTGVSSGGVLNPEHGQPGHRCDIPVGAPLS